MSKFFTQPVIGIDTSILITAININLSIIKAFNEQIKDLKKLISAQIECDETPQAFRDNMKLLLSISGIGFFNCCNNLMRNW